MSGLVLGCGGQIRGKLQRFLDSQTQGQGAEVRLVWWKTTMRRRRLAAEGEGFRVPALALRAEDRAEYLKGENR